MTQTGEFVLKPNDRIVFYGDSITEQHLYTNYVESYLARGLKVDDFAPNFSFFFSNGIDAEYTVLGRVARELNPNRR